MLKTAAARLAAVARTDGGGGGRCRTASWQQASFRGLVTDFWEVRKIHDLQEQYREAKEFLLTKKPPPDIDARGVFSNNQLDLGDIDVYGFDYDYTLARYKESVEQYIHDSARQILVEDMKYPKVLLDLEYEPQSSVRGLHYDIDKGLLLKMDQFHNIQLGSVYSGRQRVPDAEVKRLYQGSLRLPAKYVDPPPSEGPQARPNMVQLVDIFAKPMMCLLSAVIQWFVDNRVQYLPESIFSDVKDSIDRAHPLFHALVAQTPERFLEPQHDLPEYLERLKEDGGKKVFLITNSPFELVNAGMTFMAGPTWREIFDVIIVNAKKPGFFNKNAHFRKFLPDRRVFSWKQVHRLKQGSIYAKGSLTELIQLTNWESDRVLYFGDHPYADLADLSLNHGWRTGAILQEIEDEVNVMNSDEYKWGVNWATVLQHLIEDNQTRTNPSDQEVLSEWGEELEQIRNSLKVIYNPFFGSMFRTHVTSTFFTRRLFRVADIYTSRITNMNRYNLNHTFYPRRGALPHDFSAWFV